MNVGKTVLHLGLLVVFYDAFQIAGRKEDENLNPDVQKRSTLWLGM